MLVIFKVTGRLHLSQKLLGNLWRYVAYLLLTLIQEYDQNKATFIWHGDVNVIVLPTCCSSY